MVLQVSAKENLLVRRRKRVATMNESIKAIQEMVETELADNKYSEYLMRLFKTTDHQDNQGGNGKNQGSAERSDEGEKLMVSPQQSLGGGSVSGVAMAMMSGER